MTPEMGFASVTAALRAPRVTVAIPDDDHWTYWATRAVEFLSGIWGGAGGTVLPVREGGPHPAVLRLLQRYDPDYIAPLMASLADHEKARPGELQIVEDGKATTGERRKQLLLDAEARGPRLNHLLTPAQVDQIRRLFRSFTESDGEGRLFGAHPEQVPSEPLTSVSASEDPVTYETGNEMLDLAIRMRRGAAGERRDPKSDDGKGQRREIAHTLIPGDRLFEDPAEPAPFDATTAGLTSINFGFRRVKSPLIVLGLTADDFALAMAWDRFAGIGTWLPVAEHDEDWLRALGPALETAGPPGNFKPLLVTSASLSEDECHELMRRFGWIEFLSIVDGEEPDPEPEPKWEYVDPHRLTPDGRRDWALTDRWDQRMALPTTTDEAGGRSMATRFPLLTPVEGTNAVSWVIEVMGEGVHTFPEFDTSLVIAPGQSPHETWCRVTGVGIAFESGRWDFVASGASDYGRLAQPRLRWPSLFETLNSAAARTGHQVRVSAAGQSGSVTAKLFGGRDALVSSLTGRSRFILDLFATNAKNGPLTDESGVARGCGIHGSIFRTFDDVAALIASSGVVDISATDLRNRFDGLVSHGVMRPGFILDCGVCSWLDFYPSPDVGNGFACKRCSTENHLGVDRWREPIGGPKWYYDLHAVVANFLREHGDVPHLAAADLARLDRLSYGSSVAEVEFEVASIDTGKARVEIDFAILGRGVLAIGEAKSNDKLDGKNEEQRVKDAAKLFDAAAVLEAGEVCFATAQKAWSAAAITAVREAARRHGSSVVVSLLEGVGDPSRAKRTVVEPERLYGGGGPVG